MKYNEINARIETARPREPGFSKEKATLISNS